MDRAAMVMSSSSARCRAKDTRLGVRYSALLVSAAVRWPPDPDYALLGGSLPGPSDVDSLEPVRGVGAPCFAPRIKVNLHVPRPDEERTVGGR
jgi:hypothetical protein